MLPPRRVDPDSVALTPDCLLDEKGELDASEELFREALAMRRRLLGDDHPDAATVLSNLNYNVIEAADGPAALETLETNGKIDVLFTDVVLPGGVDGRDIANQARTRQPEINVLFTSGFAVDETDHENRELMEVSMLRKPYTGAELAAKIRRVIENLDGGIQ